MILPSTPFVKALVRWATGKRLPNRLPKLSLITVSTDYSSLQAASSKQWRGATVPGTPSVATGGGRRCLADTTNVGWYDMIRAQQGQRCNEANTNT